MNERRKEKQDFRNPVENKQIQTVSELMYELSDFIKKTKMKAIDWVIVSDMIKQLKRQKDNISNKVLRAMRGKFEKLQEHYQR